MEHRTIHVVHFEDYPGDVILIGELLADVKEIIFNVRHVELLTEGLQELTGGYTDIILLDLNLPDSRGFATFEAVKKAAGNVPIIIMSGMTDEELALRAVKEGAQDYITKGNISPDLLIRAIRYGIERQKLRVELQKALEQIKTLQGLLPICSYCKNIRDDMGYWHQVEDYIHDHSEAKFSHGICPKCAEKHFPDLYSQHRKKKERGKKVSE